MGLFKAIFGKRADHNRRYSKFVTSGKQDKVRRKIVRSWSKKRGGARVTRGFFG
jgi:hypothetical protein